MQIYSLFFLNRLFFFAGAGEKPKKKKRHSNVDSVQKYTFYWKLYACMLLMQLKDSIKTPQGNKGRAPLREASPGEELNEDSSFER